jgi:hypothetical protein
MRTDASRCKFLDKVYQFYRIELKSTNNAVIAITLGISGKASWAGEFVGEAVGAPLLVVEAVGEPLLVVDATDGPDEFCTAAMIFQNAQTV